MELFVNPILEVTDPEQAVFEGAFTSAFSFTLAR
jgi:hypothetical protein